MRAARPWRGLASRDVAPVCVRTRIDKAEGPPVARLSWDISSIPLAPNTYSKAAVSRFRNEPFADTGPGGRSPIGIALERIFATGI